MQEPNESMTGDSKSLGDNFPSPLGNIFYSMMEDIDSLRLWKNFVNAVTAPLILKADRGRFIVELATTIARDVAAADSLGEKLSREQMIEVFMTSVAFFDGVRERDAEAITDEMITTRQMLLDHLAVAAVTGMVGVTAPTIAPSGEVRDA